MSNTPKHRRPNAKRAARAFVATSLAGAAGIAFANVIGTAQLEGGASAEPFKAAWYSEAAGSNDAAAAVNLDTGATIDGRSFNVTYTGGEPTGTAYTGARIVETVSGTATEPSLLVNTEAVRFAGAVALPTGKRPGYVSGITGAVPAGWHVEITAGCGAEVAPGAGRSTPVTVRYYPTANDAAALDLGAGGVGVEVTPSSGTVPADVTCEPLTGAEPAA